MPSENDNADTPDSNIPFSEWKEAIEFRAMQYGGKLSFAGIALLCVFALVLLTSLIEPSN